MPTTWIRFAISDEDRARLNDLVDHFGGGSRSAYLRATLTVMESIRRAEVLRDVLPRSHRPLAGRVPRFGMYRGESLTVGEMDQALADGLG